MKKGFIPTRIIIDRDRLVNYNGEELHVNTYECSNCDFIYVMQVMITNYCPNCGVKFEETEDISL